MRAISPRDAVLVLLGAGCMHITSLLLSSSGPTIIFDSNFTPATDAYDAASDVVDPPLVVQPNNLPPSPPAVELDAPLPDPPKARPVPIPPTSLVKHAPGWTIFDNVYMSNGTLFVVTDMPDDFPAIEYITSTGLPAFNTPESIQERMPTAHDIDFISVADAKARWGDEKNEEESRVFPVEGNTLLFNDPDQFLNHYYHFCAELFFGAWAFWTGTFESDTPATFTRAIFPHTGSSWRDNPNMNSLFLRGGFPSLTVETEDDWYDRVSATALWPEDVGKPTKSRAWRFDRLLLTDRSASFRAPECGERTQRTAAEAMRGVVPKKDNGEPVYEFLPRGWWEPVRRRVLKFVGVPPEVLNMFDPEHPELAPEKKKVVVTYVSRQNVRRRLIPEDHDRLVAALEELCSRRGWELNVMQAERLSRDEQLNIAARTTYLVGVHGNGMSHLIMMPPTTTATVIEIFFPTGYAHDYEWTARSLGMRHFAVWNDTSKTYPEVTWPNYPEGFQGESIPVWGPYVAELIEQRADGKI